MAEAIVIYPNKIVIGNREYAPNDEVDPVLLAHMRPELAGELPPQESSARAVAEAIFSLHQKAMMQACLDNEHDLERSL